MEYSRQSLKGIHLFDMILNNYIVELTNLFCLSRAIPGTVKDFEDFPVVGLSVAQPHRVLPGETTEVEERAARATVCKV